MLKKYTGIVLHTLKYNDKSNIAYFFTKEEGRRSFLFPLRKSRKSAMRSVLFQPLSMVEIEAEVRPHAEIYSVREAKMNYVFRSLPYDPYKSAIALFLSEFLFRALKEEGENAPLFAYLTYSVRWLDVCNAGYSNFHLVFLMRLSRFLGLYPNLESYEDGCFFDMLNACFVTSRPFHGQFLDVEEASHVGKLMRMNYETMHLFAMNRYERRRCLEIILEYYRLHLPDFHEINSFEVLKELF